MFKSRVCGSGSSSGTQATNSPLFETLKQ